MVQIGYLNAKFDADVANFVKDMGRAADASEKTAKAITGAFKLMNNALGTLGVTLSAGAIFGKMLEESKQAESAAKKVEAVLRATGGAAGITAQKVDAVASSMSKLTGIDDELIKGGQALLLTFKGIGKDVFPAATQAMLDMSETMGQDLKASAVQLGKALNDPKEGLTALQRIGVSFSESQKTVIKSLVDTGQTAKAQAIILQEIQTEMGGTAAAARDTLSGALKALDTSFGNLFETLGSSGALDATRTAIEGLIIIIEDLTAKIPEFAAGFQAAWEQVAGAMQGIHNAIKVPVNAVLGFFAHIQNSLKMMHDDWENTIKDLQVVGQVFQQWGQQVAKFLEPVFNMVKGIGDQLGKSASLIGKDWAGVGKDIQNHPLLGGGTMDPSAFYKKDYVGEWEKGISKSIDDFSKRVTDAQKTIHDRALKAGQHKKMAAEEVAAITGLPSPADVEALLGRNSELFKKYDPAKIFAAQASNIDKSALHGMVADSKALLKDVENEITKLERLKQDAGKDKAAKHEYTEQIRQLQDLKKELTERNKILDDQEKAVKKAAEAEQELNKKYNDARISAKEMIESVQEHIEAIKNHNNVQYEAEKKLAKLNLTTQDRIKYLGQLTEALKAEKEAEAVDKADKAIESMQEQNEAIAAKVAGLEDEYNAYKKLKELTKDIEDPAKKQEYADKVKYLAEQERNFKDALESQKKTLDDIKNSTDGYTTKLAKLHQAWASGGINGKQYIETLEEIRKKQVETVQKGVKDFTMHIFDSFSKAIMEGKKLKDVFKDLGKELALLAAKKLLFEPISNAISNWAGKLYGGTMFGAPGSGSGSAGGGAAGILGGGGLGGLLGGLLGGKGGGGAPSGYNINGNPTAAKPGENLGQWLHRNGYTVNGQAAGDVLEKNQGGALDNYFQDLMKKSTGGSGGFEFTNARGLTYNGAGGNMPGINPYASGGGDKLSLMTDAVIGIRNTLDFVKISTSSGLALKVWEAHLGQPADPNKSPTTFKNPFRQANNSSSSGGSGTNIDLGGLVPLISSLVGSSKDGPAWKVIMPDCPCGPGGAQPAIYGGGGAGLMPGLGGPASPDNSVNIAAAAAHAAAANKAQMALGFGRTAAPDPGNQFLSSAQTGMYLQNLANQSNAQMNQYYQAGQTSYGQVQNLQGAWQNAILTQSAKGYSATPNWLKGLNGGNFQFAGGTGIIGTQLNMGDEGSFTPGLTGAISGKSMYAPYGGGSFSGGVAGPYFGRDANSAYIPGALPMPDYSTGRTGSGSSLMPFNNPGGVLSPEQLGIGRSTTLGGQGDILRDKWSQAPSLNPNYWLRGNMNSRALGQDTGTLVNSSDYAKLPYGTTPYNQLPAINKALLQSWAGRGFANGGEPPLGIPSLVGERGPELFVPKQGGTILPNDRLKEIMGGGAAPVINLHDYTSTASQISSTSTGADGSLHITLRDAVAGMMADPKVLRAQQRATGVKARGNRRGN